MPLMGTKDCHFQSPCVRDREQDWSPRDGHPQPPSPGLESALTKAPLHARRLGAIVVFIAAAAPVGEDMTDVLLGVKVPAWEGCAARPSDCLGSTVLCKQEQEPPGSPDEWGPGEEPSWNVPE